MYRSLKRLLAILAVRVHDPSYSLSSIERLHAAVKQGHKIFLHQSDLVAGFNYRLYAIVHGMTVHIALSILPDCSLLWHSACGEDGAPFLASYTGNRGKVVSMLFTYLTLFNILLSNYSTYLNHEEPDLRSRVLVAIHEDTHTYCYSCQHYQEHKSSQNNSCNSSRR